MRAPIPICSTRRVTERHLRYLFPVMMSQANCWTCLYTYIMHDRAVVLCACLLFHRVANILKIRGFTYNGVINIYHTYVNMYYEEVSNLLCVSN